MIDRAAIFPGVQKYFNYLNFTDMVFLFMTTAVTSHCVGMPSQDNCVRYPDTYPDMCQKEWEPKKDQVK